MSETQSEAQRKIQNYLDAVHETNPAAIKEAELRVGAQKFFADYAASIVAPHVGEERKTLVREMLKLAETAGLYNPTEAT